MTDSSKKLHILITGATSGIGKQLTKDYLLENHHVYAVGRDDEALAELKAAWLALGPHLLMYLLPGLKRMAAQRPPFIT